MKLYSKTLMLVLFLLLFFLGILLRRTNTTSFLGLVCWGLGLIIVCYCLLHYLQCRSWKPAKVLSTLLTVFLCVGVCLASVTGFLIGKSAAGDAGYPCQYIVVLGAKVNGTEPSRTLAERIGAAATYLQNHPDSVAVVSGGQGADEGISEAQCMYNELVQCGITPDRIWMEDKATSTYENITFSLDVIEEKTGDRPSEIGLLSSEFHLYRGSLLARECGVNACGIPAKTENPVYFLNYFLREIAGVWHYAILGS